MGAVNVLVSMAGDGAILADENGKIHACGVCSGTVKNSVGAGDSMVAGFIAGCEKKGYEYALNSEQPQAVQRRFQTVWQKRI